MYESFFGLEREPFSIAPDPQFLYMSAYHKEALAHLAYGLRRGGVVLLTGEIGAGKTTVWRCFLEQLPPYFDVAYVVNPKLGVNALLTRVCEELGVERPEEADAATWDPIDAIHGHVLLSHARGRRSLIVVDEAQALSIEVLEQLRLLTNLDTSDRKLVQLLLIGQPELRALLERPVLEPLAQRVVARFHLQALAEAETTRYIQHRMRVAGLQGHVPFDAEALARIHKLCGGVPRRINVLCDRALIRAHEAKVRQVDRRFIDFAATEVFGRVRAGPAAAAAAADGTPVRKRPGWLTGTLGAVAVFGVALIAAPLVSPLVAPVIEPTWAAVLASFGGAARSAAPPGPAASVAAPAPVARAAAASAPAVRTAAPQPAAQPVAAPVEVVMGPGASGPSRGLDLGELEAAFEPAAADEAGTWRALAPLWGVTLGAGDPCVASVAQALHCYRSRGGLGPIRQLGRPGILKLADERGRVAHVLLTGLGDDTATVRLRGVERRVPLALLARAWRGDFATFWRAPPGYRVGEVVSPAGPVGVWLGERLAKLDGKPAQPANADALAARIFAFQLAQGLAPDGLAGPLTLMQIARASGSSDEPRLKASMSRTSAELAR